MKEVFGAYMDRLLYALYKKFGPGVGNFLALIVGRRKVSFLKAVQGFTVKGSERTLEIVSINRVNKYQKGIEHRFHELISEYRVPELEPDSVVIDCGANIGEFSLAVKALYPDSVIYAYEPSKLEWRALQKNCEDMPLVHLKNVALSKESGIARFYQKSEGADSSLEELKDFEDCYEVEVRTLDSEFEGIDVIHLLKLEAEGHEVEILKGGVNTLRKTQWIVADLGFEGSDEGRSTLPPALSFLLEQGFNLVDNSQLRHTYVFYNENYKAS